MDGGTARVQAALRRLERRRRRLETAGLILLVMVLLGLTGYAVGSWAERVWCAFAIVVSVVVPYALWAVTKETDDDLHPVEVVESHGRRVVVRDRYGRQLTWRVRAPLFQARPAPGAAWATTPPRRLHSTTLYVEATDGDLRWYPPAEVAVYAPGGSRVAVVEDDRQDDAIRQADPVALLTAAQAAAAAVRRHLLLQFGLFAALVVTGAVVRYSVPDATVDPLTTPLIWAGMCWFFSRGPSAGAAGVWRATRLELVEGEGERADDRIRVRAADGTRLSWSLSASERDVPLAGPMWVTAPVEAGHRIAIVCPGGRHGAHFIGAATKAVPSGPLPPV